jgi:hypothetical protein
MAKHLLIPILLVLAFICLLLYVQPGSWPEVILTFFHKVPLVSAGLRP